MQSVTTVWQIIGYTVEEENDMYTVYMFSWLQILPMQRSFSTATFLSLRFKSVDRSVNSTWSLEILNGATEVAAAVLGE